MSPLVYHYSADYDFWASGNIGFILSYFDLHCVCYYSVTMNVRGISNDSNLMALCYCYSFEIPVSV